MIEPGLEKQKAVRWILMPDPALTRLRRTRSGCALTGKKYRLAEKRYFSGYANYQNVAVTSCSNVLMATLSAIRPVHFA